MKYESLAGVDVPKIGFGTWGIGGKASPDRSTDRESLTALRSALRLGYRHFDTAEMYAAGHAEELLGQAIRDEGVPRGQLFITTKVMPEHLRCADVLKACERSLHRLVTDYIDLYLIHWPNPRVDLSETFRALNELLGDGRVRRVGVSNFDLPLLERSRELAAAPIFCNQVPFSLRNRSYAKNGVLDYCQRSEVLLAAYTPFEEGGLKIDGRLASIARTHSVTSHQVALAWLISHPRVITIPMSRSPGHQRENLEAAEIQLSPAELALLE